MGHAASNGMVNNAPVTSPLRRRKFFAALSSGISGSGQNPAASGELVGR
jgi:hypothetical protein